MARVLGRSGAPAVVTAPNLLQVSKDEVAANSASARKMVGRTAEALNKLRQAAQEEGYREGYEAGFEAGRLEGLAQVEAEHRVAIENFVSDLQAKVDEIGQAAERWVLDAEKDLAQLAALIAAKIVAQELKTDPEVICSIAKEAVAQYAHSSSIRVMVSPSDIRALEARKEQLLAASSQLRNVEVVSDPTIAGGCIVESEGGFIDSTIDTRLECILDSIREAA